MHVNLADNDIAIQGTQIHIHVVPWRMWWGCQRSMRTGRAVLAFQSGRDSEENSSPRHHAYPQRQTITSAAWNRLTRPRPVYRNGARIQYACIVDREAMLIVSLSVLLFRAVEADQDSGSHTCTSSRATIVIGPSNMMQKMLTTV